MPVADDLRGLVDRAMRDLDAVHDFFEHSKLVWRSFNADYRGAPNFQN